MPVSSAAADPYTTTDDGTPQPGSVSAQYAAAVAALLALLAAYLAPRPGVPWPDWATLAMGRIVRFRSDITRILADLTVRVDVTVTAAMDRVVAGAVTEAARDARWAGALPSADPDRVRALLDALAASHTRVGAVLEDAFRAAVTAGRRGAGDPLPDIQRVLDDLAARGITGYTDTARRRWSLETYVETVTRSAYSDAALAAYLRVLAAAGIGLVQVSSNPGACPQCVPWEHAILSTDGRAAGRYLVGSREVYVAGSLQDAREAGLFHPWCRHRLTPLLAAGGRRFGRGPSIDRAARAERRYRHRTAQAWTRRTRVALTPTARSRAATHAARWRRQP